MSVLQCQTEKTLHELTLRYQSIVEDQTELICRYRSNGKLSFVNGAYARYFRKTQAELIDKNFIPNIPKADLEMIARHLVAITPDNPVATFEHRIIMPSGDLRWHQWTHRGIYMPDASLVEYQAVGLDITDRKRAEEALRTSEDYFKTIFNEAPLGVALIDSLSGHIYEVNPMFARIAGRTMEEMVKIDWMSITHPDDVQKDLDNMAQLNAGKINGFQMEKRYLHHDGAAVWINMTIAPVKVEDKSHPRHLCMIEDITERKRLAAEKAGLEEQNRQLKKAESLRRMAGAIAHNFNNQLQVVIGNLELVEGDLAMGRDPAGELSDAGKAASKAAELSKMMLTYIGQSSAKREQLDLAELYRMSLPMLQASMPKGVIMEADLPVVSPFINGNAIEIQQVLTNLVTNALESMVGKEGTVHLNVGKAFPADIPALHRFPLEWRSQEQAYSCMEVMDSGCGIQEKDVEKIFDPFFSTKFTGRGMGLPVVLGIVRAHHGCITVENRINGGSVFKVFFPLSTQIAPCQPVQVAKAPRVVPGATVLLVEDEEGVRKMATLALVNMGFTVLQAKDGVEAVEVFRQKKDQISCLLCDLTMPRMGGWETISAIRAIRNDLPIILASGYDEASVMAGEHPELPDFFLNKPYGLGKLGNAIGCVIAGKKEVR